MPSRRCWPAWQDPGGILWNCLLLLDVLIIGIGIGRLIG